MRVLLHHGDHIGTTGRLLAADAGSLDWVCRQIPEGHHLDWPREVEQHQADAAVWVESGSSSYPLRTWDCGKPTVGYLIDSHMHYQRTVLQAQLFDRVYLAQKNDARRLSATHPDVRWLPLAAPSNFVSGERGVRFPVAMVGRVFAGSDREAVGRALNRVLAMNDWRRWHDTDEMRNVYLSASVVVNIPIRGDLNMRVFEAMACGAALLSPSTTGSDELFESDRHYLRVPSRTKPTPEDYLARLMAAGPEELEVVGRAGREIVAKHHTYAARARTIQDGIASIEPVAPVRSMSDRERTGLLADLAAGMGDLTLWSRTALLQRSHPAVLARTGALAASRNVYRRLRSLT